MRTANSRLGWHNHFAKGTSSQALHLATWYLLLHLAFDAKEGQEQ